MQSTEPPNGVPVQSPPAHWKNVFDRLADPATYTGVYAERFKSGPGINHDDGVKLHHHRSSYEGSTNTGTDEVIRDIRFITRPNLNRDRGDASSSPFARATEKVRAKYDAAERALLVHLQQAGQTGGPSVYVLPTSGTAALGGSSASSVVQGDNGSNLDGSVTGLGAEHHQAVAINASKPIDTNVQLQLLFQYYCRFGRTGATGEDSDTLDAFNFAKFSRDCPNLLDNRLNSTEVDLIFIKCKAKTGRRLHYGQWLDGLQGMASVKYEHVEDPAHQFAMLLSNHVFGNPASVAIGQAVRSGLIKVETTASSWSLGSTSGPVEASQVMATASPSSRLRPLTALGPFSQAAAAAGLSPRSRTRLVTGMGPTSPAGSLFATGPVPFNGSVASPGSGSAPVLSASALGVSPTAAPGDLYDLIARKALEMQLACGGDRSAPVAVDQASVFAAAAALGITLPSPGGAYANVRPPLVSGSPGAQIGAHASSDISGAVVRTLSPVFRPVSQATHPHHPVNAGLSSIESGRVGGGIAQGLASVFSGSASTTGGSPRRSTSAGKRASYGEAGFRATVPGEGIRAGSVYEKLTDPEHFTGVYKRAWFTDGRINHFSDTGVSLSPSGFKGHTNTGTNEVIHDIRHLLRPNLKSGMGWK